MNNNQDPAGIAMAKFQANSRYFGLFDSHIPAGSTENTENILLLTLGNPDCITKIVTKNPSASYTVVDDVWTLDCLHTLPPSKKMNFIESLNEYNIIEAIRNLKGLGVKFDRIIMNPPFNLHLEIIDEAMKLLKDDNSVCINLSRVRWLQDPFAKEKKSSAYNKFKHIRDRIESLEVLNPIETNVLFGIGCSSLGIYTIGKGGYDCENLISPIVKKVLEKTTSFPVLEKNAKDGWRVRFPFITSGQDGGRGAKHAYYFGKLFSFFEGRKDNKWWWEFYQANQYTKRTETITLSVKFASKIEAENFIKTLDTSFGKYYTQAVVVDVHVSPKQILWMGDAVNPRTGLKGYLGEWTNEDFYCYFELTDNEIKTVEKNDGEI